MKEDKFIRYINKLNELVEKNKTSNVKIEIAKLKDIELCRLRNEEQERKGILKFFDGVLHKFIDRGHYTEIQTYSYKGYELIKTSQYRDITYMN